MDAANPLMIILARESRGFKQSPLAGSIGVSQAFLSQVENGQKNATDELIGKLSEHLEYPISFFYRDAEVKNLPVPFYRKRKGFDRLAINRQVKARVNIKRLELAKLLRSVELPAELRIPRIDMTEYQGSIRALAQELRLQWHIPSGPLENVTRLLESLGVLVFHFDFGTNKIDALSIFEIDDDLPPLVFVNLSFPGDRLRWTLTHELAHIILHHHLPVFDLSIDCEREADSFAAEFLLPANEIRPYFNRVRLETLINLKRHWKVSLRALIMRAADLNKILDSKKRFLFMQVNKYYGTKEPVEISVEHPTLLGEILDTHLRDLEYTPGTLSDVVDLFLPEFKRDYLGQKHHGLRLVQ